MEINTTRTKCVFMRTCSTTLWFLCKIARSLFVLHVFFNICALLHLAQLTSLTSKKDFVSWPSTAATGCHDDGRQWPLDDKLLTCFGCSAPEALQPPPEIVQATLQVTGHINFIIHLVKPFTVLPQYRQSILVQFTTFT